MADHLSMREHADRSQEGPILDVQMQPGSPSHFDHEHATHSDTHPAYSQMEVEETETHHDAFFDGSEMIHAAFAAQAIELAERERADALQSRVQADFHTHEHGRLDFHHFDYGHSDGVIPIPNGDIISVTQEMENSRPQKRRKTTIVSERKGKTKCRTDIQDGESTHELFLHNSTDSPVIFGENRRPRAKRQSPADVASRKQSHISAEQKRRAAIKTGYEALYRVIPALRDVDLKEGKGRGGSGPGGGGVRAIKPEGKLSTDGEAKKRTSQSPAPPGAEGVANSTLDAASSRNGSPNREGDVQNRDYHYSQQYDEYGKPLRPGVRSVFPLVRQPGSEVIDGRQGPRSESVVLQKTVNYLRQEQIFRLQLLKRLASLRQLAKRTFPEHEYDRLTLCSRLVETEPSGSTTLESTANVYPESLATLPGDVDTADNDAGEIEHDQPILQTRTSRSRSPLAPQHTQMSDGHDAPIVEQSVRDLDLATIPPPQGSPERAEESVYPATFEAALANDYQHFKRAEPDVEDMMDRTTQKHTVHTLNDQHQEPLLATEELPFKAPLVQGRATLVNWEAEWDGGAFVEGEDVD